MTFRRPNKEGLPPEGLSFLMIGLDSVTSGAYNRPPLHAGGLRYHGMAPLVSHLVGMKLVEPLAVDERSAFDAATPFMRTEGILPAPESAHAAAAVIREALRAKAEGRETVILFNQSGHGYLDIGAFNGRGTGG